MSTIFCGQRYPDSERAHKHVGANQNLQTGLENQSTSSLASSPNLLNHVSLVLSISTLFRLKTSTLAQCAPPACLETKRTTVTIQRTWWSLQPLHLKPCHLQIIGVFQRAVLSRRRFPVELPTCLCVYVYVFR